MGGKRVGLGRTQVLIENLRRELTMNGTSMAGVDFVVEAKTASFTYAGFGGGCYSRYIA